MEKIRGCPFANATIFLTHISQDDNLLAGCRRVAVKGNFLIGQSRFEILQLNPC